MLQSAQNLSEKIDQLLSKFDDLVKENDLLKKQLEEKEQLLDSFKKQDNFSNIVNGIIPEGEDAERLKARIEENIQELDKCIALLSSK